MPISYLQNQKWINATREERLFCSYLYFDLIKGKKSFTEIIDKLNFLKSPVKIFNNDLNLKSNAFWDVGYEVCFYRDLLYFFNNKKPIRKINIERENKGLFQFPEKRTFDLCFFSENELIIIEAKSQQGLESNQCNEFLNDLKYLEELFKILNISNPPKVKLIIIASSHYLKSRSFIVSNGIGRRFIEDTPNNYISAFISWKQISDIQLFKHNKEIYLRADNSYRH